MFKQLTPVLAVALLSGCVSTKTEQYHQESLAAIKSVETNLSRQVDRLELKISNQSEYIESLEYEIDQLNEQVEHFGTKTLSHLRQDESRADETPDASPEPIASIPSNEVVLGAIERVTIDAIQQTFDARVDTGAATSSLDASDIEEFERNSKTWVRFHLTDIDNKEAEQNWIEAPVVRFVRIRQASSSEVERRPVIELWVKVGKIHEKAQFTLADRSQMSHPVLLGREFIRDIAVVDVSQKYIHTEKTDKKEQQ
ncbi:ATP-dependent zinc protease family protein [Vibrio olivae]|uniref:ATP-dependent zinc protease n=1 Tax=Vibrio olivae TaxID=1243002 RepID=A0ABV5HHQ4_9VIBR